MPKRVLLGVEDEEHYPFSDAVEANGFVFLAGVVGSRPDADLAVPGGTEAETRRALELVAERLRAVGLTPMDVVQVTVHLVDLDGFEAMNRAYRELFPAQQPARTTVWVSRLASNYRVELTVVAAR